MDYTEDDLLAFIERHDEHEAYYRDQLAQLRAKKRKQRAYICGGMAGRPNMGLELFMDAAAEVEATGTEAVVPHSLTPYQHDGPCAPVYGKGVGAEPDHDGGCYLRGDIAVMVLCDYVYRLPTWHGSKGAGIECGLAEHLGIPIVDAPVCSCQNQDNKTVVHRLGGHPCYLPED